MKIRRLKKITIGSIDFSVVWDKKLSGAKFGYDNNRN